MRIVAGAGADTAMPVPRFEAAPCPFTLGDGETEGDNVSCGYLTVPEDRTQPNGRTLRLAVATLKALHPNAAPEPVVFLNGGPGQGTEGTIGLFRTDLLGIKELGADHDFVFFDQRGTGFSQPSLACHEEDDLAPGSPTAAILAADTACHDRLVGDGIDLNQYNSKANAADVNDLVHALGYTKVNLLGASYGTRLALVVMRDFPEIVRSTVIGSIDPPQENILAGRITGFDDALRRVFDGCVQDPDCDAKYPDLHSAFRDGVVALNAKPAKVSVKSARTGKTTTVSVDGKLYTELVYLNIFLGAILVPVLPIFITQVRDGDYRLFTPLLSVTDTVSDSVSAGMNYSVQCSEEYAFTNLDDVIAAAGDALPEIQAIELQSIRDDLAVCGIWNVRKAPDSEKAPVTSDIPTLVLSGAYDPITPPRYGDDAAQTLSHSYVVVLPYVGHDPITTGGPCGIGIQTAFLAHPDTAPDASCAAAMIPKLGQLPMSP